MRRRFILIIFMAVAVIISQNAYAAELIIGARAEPAIDPHFLYAATNVGYSRHVFGRLVDRDDNSRLIPDLAVSWKTVDDNSWEFKLRKGVKFHDGSDFTAQDVAFSIERIPNVPNNPGTYVGNIRGITDVKIIDSYTVIIKTEKPNPILPVKLGNVAIVSKKAVQGKTTADFNSGDCAIGTGPYTFVEYVPGDRYVLKRNENYWGEKPSYENVTFKIITNSAARVAALLGGDVDLIDYVPPSEVAQLKKKKVKIAMRPSDRTIFLICDTTSDKPAFVTDKDGQPLNENPLKDRRVRRALSKALSRDAIASRVMEGLADPIGQTIPKGWYSHNPDIKVEKYDPQGAKELLAAAGYPEGFGLTIHGPNDRYVNDAKVVQAIAQMLSHVGLAMKVDTMPKSIYFKKFTPPEREFNLSLLGWGSSASGDSSHMLQSVVHSTNKAQKMGSWNPGYANPELDKTIESAVKIMDTKERDKALQETMALAMQDYGIIPLYTQVTVNAMKENVTYTPRADESTLAMNASPAK